MEVGDVGENGHSPCWDGRDIISCREASSSLMNVSEAINVASVVIDVAARAAEQELLGDRCCSDETSESELLDPSIAQSVWRKSGLQFSCNERLNSVVAPEEAKRRASEGTDVVNGPKLSSFVSKDISKLCTTMLAAADEVVVAVESEYCRGSDELRTERREPGVVTVRVSKCDQSRAGRWRRRRCGRSKTMPAVSRCSSAQGGGESINSTARGRLHASRGRKRKARGVSKVVRCRDSRIGGAGNDGVPREEQMEASCRESYAIRGLLPDDIDLNSNCRESYAVDDLLPDDGGLKKRRCAHLSRARLNGGDVSACQVYEYSKDCDDFESTDRCPSVESCPSNASVSPVVLGTHPAYHSALETSIEGQVAAVDESGIVDLGEREKRRICAVEPVMPMIGTTVESSVVGAAAPYNVACPCWPFICSGGCTSSDAENSEEIMLGRISALEVFFLCRIKPSHFVFPPPHQLLKYSVVTCKDNDDGSDIDDQMSVPYCMEPV